MIKGFAGKRGVITSFDLKKGGVKAAYWIMYAFMVLAVLISIFPLFWIIISGFKTTQELYSGVFWPSRFDFSKIPLMWKKVNFGKYLTNSAVIVVGATAVSVVINGLGAYVLSVIKPKGGKIIFFLIMLSLMVPAITNMVPLFKNIVDLKLLNNPLPIILSYGANAFYLIMFKTFFDSLPVSVIEAARVDGAGKIRIFVNIVLPMCLSIIMIVAIFTVNASWSDFLFPLIVLTRDQAQTVMVKIYTLNKSVNFSIDYTLLAITFAIIPPVALFVIFQKQITGNVMASGLKE